MDVERADLTLVYKGVFTRSTSMSPNPVAHIICSNRIYSPEHARELAKQMIGSNLITKQTGAGGRICNAVRGTLNVNLESKFTPLSRSCWLRGAIPHMSITLPS